MLRYAMLCYALLCYTITILNLSPPSPPRGAPVLDGRLRGGEPLVEAGACRRFAEQPGCYDYAVVCEQICLYAPWPCNPAAKAALQPLIWLLLSSISIIIIIVVVVVVIIIIIIIIISRHRHRRRHIALAWARASRRLRARRLRGTLSGPPRWRAEIQ